jgi:hypothetical protein
MRFTEPCSAIPGRSLRSTTSCPPRSRNHAKCPLTAVVGPKHASASFCHRIRGRGTSWPQLPAVETALGRLYRPHSLLVRDPPEMGCIAFHAHAWRPSSGTGHGRSDAVCTIWNNDYELKTGHPDPVQSNPVWQFSRYYTCTNDGIHTCIPFEGASHQCRNPIFDW